MSSMEQYFLCVHVYMQVCVYVCVVHGGQRSNAFWIILYFWDSLSLNLCGNDL